MKSRNMPLVFVLTFFTKLFKRSNEKKNSVIDEDLACKTRVSIFASTELIDVAFYEILGEKRETLYVGQTTQGVGKRYDQHKRDLKKSHWRNKMEGVLEISINGKSGPFKMTPYEAAVVGLYEINARGGIGRKQ